MKSALCVASRGKTRFFEIHPKLWPLILKSWLCPSKAGNYANYDKDLESSEVFFDVANSTVGQCLSGVHVYDDVVNSRLRLKHAKQHTCILSSVDKKYFPYYLAVNVFYLRQRSR